MDYYIGIDGGGTKTLIRLINEKEETLDTHITLGSNISSIGYHKTKTILKEGIQEILERNELLVESCQGICIGAAGVDREKERLEVKNILEDLGFQRVQVMNDTYIVLKTVTDKKEGIVIIAGTGSIVLGIKKDESIRAGGWGYKLGDEGSAYWIGMKGIKAVIDAYDQVTSATQLTEIILAHFNLSQAEDFIELFYKDEISKNQIAEVSKLVDHAATLGDPIAIRILEKGSTALGKQVLAVYKRLFQKTDSKIPVILNGSVVLNSKIFNKSLVNYLKNISDRFDIEPIKNDPSYGACKYAKSIVRSS